VIQSRPFKESDRSGLQSAIDNDKIHPGQWNLDDFIGVVCEVFYDEHGPIVFVIYSLDLDESRLRLSTVWVDSNDFKRNGKTIIFGVKQAAARARKSGFKQLIFSTKYEKLATFCTHVLGFRRVADEDYVLDLEKEG
jgi:hypothetical protein